MKIYITYVYQILLFISVASSALLFIIVASENAQTSYYSSFKTNETSETDNNTELTNNMEVDDLDTTIPITELYDLHKLEEKYIEESTSFEPIINGEAGKKRILIKIQIL